MGQDSWVSLPKYFFLELPENETQASLLCLLVSVSHLAEAGAGSCQSQPEEREALVFSAYRKAWLGVSGCEGGLRVSDEVG